MSSLILGQIWVRKVTYTYGNITIHLGIHTLCNPNKSRLSIAIPNGFDSRWGRQLLLTFEGAWCQNGTNPFEGENVNEVSRAPKKDHLLAFKYFKKAADLGLMEALEKLGDIIKVVFVLIKTKKKLNFFIN